MGFDVLHQISIKFLFIVTYFNIPSERVKKQGDILHLAASALVQGSFFLPGEKTVAGLEKPC